MDDSSFFEEILTIYRIKGKDDEWCPAVKIVANHSGDPVWVASLLYNIYNRYISTIPDADQNKFECDTRKVLDILFDIGVEHIEEVDMDD